VLADFGPFVILEVYSDTVAGLYTVCNLLEHHSHHHILLVDYIRIAVHNLAHVAGTAAVSTLAVEDNIEDKMTVQEQTGLLVVGIQVLPQRY